MAEGSRARRDPSGSRGARRTRSTGSGTGATGGARCSRSTSCSRGAGRPCCTRSASRPCGPRGARCCFIAVNTEEQLQVIGKRIVYAIVREIGILLGCCGRGSPQ